MKKVIFTIFALVLALTCAVSSFAYRGHTVTWDEDTTLDADGNSVLVGKSLNNADITSGTNKIRESWTASRIMPQENAMFVELENGASDGVCVKLTGTEYITNDPESDGQLAGLAYVALDMRCDKVGTFFGVVIDCDQEAGWNNASYADFEATNGSFILETGYGFTILDNNKIRAFINANGGTPIYYDFDLPFDSKADFHNYGLYRDEDEGKTYLTVDDKYIATFQFPGVKEKSGIFDSNGNGVALGADDMTNDGHIWFATVGECEVYIDNVVYNEFEDYPEPLKMAAPSDATEAPADATEAPADATEAPADATEAPADPTEAPADPTEAPAEATKAPADATQAPADSTAEPKKEGCGNMISGGAIVLAAACAIALKKKEN